MNCNPKPFKDTAISVLSSYEDKFLLNNNCNAKITIVCHEAKPCLLSYKLCTIGCNKILFIYGAILVKLTYTYDNNCKKYSQVFVKPINKEVSVPTSVSKISSITVNLVDKYNKRLCNDLLLGFYNLEFCIKIRSSITATCDDFNNKNLSDICTTNTLTLDNEEICDEASFCDTNFNLVTQQNIDQKSLNDIQNDCFNSISSTPYNTRL